MNKTIRKALASLILASSLFQSSQAHRAWNPNAGINTTATVIKTAAGVATAVLIQDRHRRAHELIGSTAAFYSEEINGITVTVKQLNVNNTNLFSKRRLFKRHQPLEITIQNSTGRAIRLGQECLNMPLANPRKISKKMQRNPFIAFFWPWQSMTTTKAYAFLFLGPFGSLGVTLRDNKRIRQQFESYATDLSYDLYIPAHSVVSRYMYVPREMYRPNMTLSIFDGKGETLDYNIRLRPAVII